MQIFIRNINGKSIVLDVNQNDNILDIKTKLFEKYKIPINYQRLNYCGKELLDNSTLNYYKITNDASINLLFRLLSCQKCNQNLIN